jgi:excisionase family DNA binding protein
VKPFEGAIADRFIDDREAAAFLGLSRTYLRQLRVKGGGCRFFRFGRAVRYRLTDLDAWASRKAVESTSDGGTVVRG